MNRRTFLASGTGTAVVGVSGCLSDQSLSDLRGKSDDEPDMEWCPDGDEHYQCAEGEPLEVDKNFDDDENVSSNGNGTVKVTYPNFSPIWPLEEWCLFTGAQDAFDHTREQLENDTNLRTHTTTFNTDQTGTDRSAGFYLYEGDVEKKGSVDLETVVQTAPAYVETTITTQEQKHACTVPVYVGTVQVHDDNFG